MSSPACNVVVGDYGGGVDVRVALCAGAGSVNVVGCCIDGGWHWLVAISVSVLDIAEGSDVGWHCLVVMCV